MRFFLQVSFSYQLIPGPEVPLESFKFFPNLNVHYVADTCGKEMTNTIILPAH
jgi:hypothetical protein